MNFVKFTIRVFTIAAHQKELDLHRREHREGKKKTFLSREFIFFAEKDKLPIIFFQGFRYDKSCFRPKRRSS